MLYHVLSNGDSWYGFAEDAQGWLEIDPKGKTRRRSFLEVTKTMAILLRKGYVRLAKPHHWDRVRGCFTLTLPDLSWGGKEWIISVEPPAIETGLSAVEGVIRSAPPSVIQGVEIDAWAARQRMNESLLVAFTDHPAWALALAEVAKDSGWLLRSNPFWGPSPAKPPSTEPEIWDQWLSKVFSIEDVREARIAMGLNLLKNIPHTLTVTGGEELIGI